jgi:hypothetical protein
MEYADASAAEWVEMAKGDIAHLLRYDTVRFDRDAGAYHERRL